MSAQRPRIVLGAVQQGLPARDLLFQRLDALALLAPGADGGLDHRQIKQPQAAEAEGGDLEELCALCGLHRRRKAEGGKKAERQKAEGRK